jgi:hypothetical protein
MNCRLRAFSYLFIFALLLPASCIDDPSPVPKDEDYVRALLDQNELRIDKENGKIEKQNFGSFQMEVAAQTKYGERIHFAILSGLKPGTYLIDSLNSSNDSVIISVTSFKMPRSDVEMTYGKMIIEAIGQNPLVLKGSFSGKLIYEWSPNAPQQYDTVLLTGGKVDIKF